MKYLWTEDTGAGLHFWKLVNQLFFDDALVVESKESNQGLLDALADIDMKEDDKYYIAFDYVVDNQDIRNKYRMLKSIADKAEGKIIILDMICFEYLILVFDKLVAWTGTGKTDKIKIREEVLATVEDHRINLSKIDDEKTLQYIAGFKRYSTERVMKSLVGEFTQNEKWSVKGVHMGECWYKDCCVSEHPDNLRCGKPEVEDGSEKMRMLMQSQEVHKIISIIIILFQSVVTIYLQVSAQNVYNLDKKLAYDIVETLQENHLEDRKIAIIGCYNPNKMLKGEVLGHSFFEWDNFDGQTSNGRVQGFFRCLGLDNQFVENDQLPHCYNLVKDKEIYLKNKKVYINDDIVIIKLSESQKRDV